MDCMPGGWGRLFPFLSRSPCTMHDREAGEVAGRGRPTLEAHLFGGRIRRKQSRAFDHTN